MSPKAKHQQLPEDQHAPPPSAPQSLPAGANAEKKPLMVTARGIHTECVICQDAEVGCFPRPLGQPNLITRGCRKSLPSLFPLQPVSHRWTFGVSCD